MASFGTSVANIEASGLSSDDKGLALAYLGANREQEIYTLANNGNADVRDAIFRSWAARERQQQTQGGVSSSSSSSRTQPSLSDFPSPSDFSRSGAWGKNIAKYNIRCGRPDIIKNASPPLALYDPALGQFIDDLDSINPMRDDFVAAVALARIMSSNYDQEAQFQTKWNSWAHEHLQVPFTTASAPNGKGSGTISPDAAVVHVTNIDDVPFHFIFREDKVGFGQGPSDANMQLVGDAFLFSRTDVRSGEVFITRTRMPMILLGQAGSVLSVSIALRLPELCVQTVALVNLVLDRYTGPMKIARFVAALRAASARLREHYSHLPLVDQGKSLGFPYCTLFVDTHGASRIFTYRRRYGDSMVFEADINDSSVVMVKFTRTYSTDVHEMAARAGLAPKLLGTRDLHDGWRMIVMEYIDGISVFDLVNRGILDRDTRSCIRNDLDKFVQTLQGGEAKYVHGDLRNNNIIFDSKSRQTYVVDFDWAGMHGSVRYPSHMNHWDIAWPDGAVELKLIALEHDRYWIADDVLFVDQKIKHL
eukprot:TRINITY_DN4982_c0_g1_i7.p1 TRINITY_DN4982_c0_g1~~TRINITY_DN4982_c0_g1_i7.p1  ORF type:complete len:542 (-),score=41.78 TRINITY_DN4982_c0_g1_i7:34-1635(-)